MPFRAICITTLSVAILALFGCGPDVETAGPAASGTVTLDGKPIQGGSLEFYPQEQGGNSAFAPVQEDGSFQINTANNSNGIAPGKYKVTYTPADSTPSDDGTSEPSKVPNTYQDSEKTPLSIEVKKDGENVFKLDLESED